MNKATRDKLKSNPFYKPSPGQMIPDDDEQEANIKTFGVLPKQNTIKIPKHPTDPKVRTHNINN